MTITTNERDLHDISQVLSKLTPGEYSRLGVSMTGQERMHEFSDKIKNYFENKK